MKLTYNGTDERVFPTLGIIVKPGDEFDAPEGFNHPDYSSGKTFNKVATPIPSAASDLTNKESE